ncbi:hypothetical protein LTR86_011169 [Recurvomyces mirabilis]|nr:hypothetical protein LTR86_011169 [Recurvomyces mirabilis]
MNAPQTVAQAVQATTAVHQAAQQQHQSPLVQPPSVPASAINNLTCLWQGCGERTDTAESLYDHICERHVGRNSTNNLNLTCQWGACRTTTVKRNNITSHIRVHVPLKPHKCDFCGKLFKRPQDLKKHVKTHADDSVLDAGSPAQSGRDGAVGDNGGMTSNGMGEYSHTAHLAHLANRLPSSAQPSYYPTHDNSMNNPHPAYQQGLHQHDGNGVAYAQHPGNGQYAVYGSVSYPNSAATHDIQSMDTRGRVIEALNDFLGDIKRRAIDPSCYYDVGQRLGSGGALPLPVGGGYNTGYSGGNSATGFGNFNDSSLLESFNQGGDAMSGGGLQGALAQTGYSPPISNARTKNDLQDIDRFLKQLQQTVYETSNQTAATGIQQLGVHAQCTADYGCGNQYHARSSGSPSKYQSTTGASFGAITAANITGMTSSASTMDTPALTPASVSSCSSSVHSPMSSHGRGSLGSGQAMYPNLPSVTDMSDLSSGYPVATSAPASGLASGFERMDGRRYGGGRLQRQTPNQDTDVADADDGARTPKPADASRPRNQGNSSIDPALGGEDSDSASTPAARSEEADKRQEDWVWNIRTIESLRKWIGERLNRGEYEEGEVGDARQGTDDATARAQAEIAKMVEARMAWDEPEHKPQLHNGEVKYPSLPGA